MHYFDASADSTDVTWQPLASSHARARLSKLQKNFPLRKIKSLDAGPMTVGLRIEIEIDHYEIHWAQIVVGDVRLSIEDIFTGKYVCFSAANSYLKV